MNRLVIIGNGFDMAHGLKTSYKDFINWYWEQRLNDMLTENTAVSEDLLCRLEIINNKERVNWFNYFLYSRFREIISGEWKYSPLDIIYYFKEDKTNFKVTFSPFLEKILQSLETKGWVDIENDYYQLLKHYAECDNHDNLVKDLNNQLEFLKSKLLDYLGSLREPQPIVAIEKALTDYIRVEDLSTKGKNLAKEIDESIEIDANSFGEERYGYEHFSALDPENTMLLIFNYTGTVGLYYQVGGYYPNYIHGKLGDPTHIVFGYGDELDKNYSALRDKNDKDLLLNDKSVKYLETSNYSRLLDFLTAAPFQVLIMGHSCGNSDRTLLNTIFEHENCVSIKPYYHQMADGSDNYLEIVQNILRNFKDSKLYRDRVVNKELCVAMSKTIRCNFMIKVCLGNFIDYVNSQQKVTVNLTEVQFDHYCDTLKYWQSTDEWKNRKVEDGENTFIKRDLPDIYDLIMRRVKEEFTDIWNNKNMFSFDQIHIFTAEEIISKVKA